MTTVAPASTRAVDRATWDQLVATSPQGSVFTTSAFLDALDLDWSGLVVGGEAPRLGAVILRDPSGEIARSPIPFTQYQGVLLGGELTRAAPHRMVHESLELVGQLLASLETERRVSWSLHHAFTDIRPFSWFNYHAPERGQFRVEVRYSGLIPIDATGMDGVLARSRATRRQEYRKASDRFAVAPTTDLDLLDQLHARTFDRQGLTRPAREVALLRRIAGAAIREGFGELLAGIDRDGRPAGAVLFLFDRGSAYYLIAANDPEFRATGISTLMVLAGIERGIRRGVRQVDVVGMNSPSRGDFKSSFGAIPVPYYQVHWERP